MAQFYYDDGTPVSLAQHRFNTNPDNFQDWTFEEDVFEEIQNGTFTEKFVEFSQQIGEKE